MRQAFPSGVVLRTAVTDEGKPANFPRTFVSRTSLRDSAHTVVAIPSKCPRTFERPQFKPSPPGKVARRSRDG